MNIIEAFIIPHPYLFTWICLSLIWGTVEILDKNKPSDHDGDNEGYY